jgi:hypothetical protein
MSDFLTAGAFVLALVGIPLTYVLTKRSRQVPRLRASIDFNVLLAPTDDLQVRGLSIALDGTEISQISRSYFAFWNAGGDTVEGGSIVETDPLRLQFETNETPLQARVIRQSRPPVDFSIELIDNCVLLSFSFLDTGDGAFIEVLHNGTVTPELAGTIMGARVPDLMHQDFSPEVVEGIAGKRQIPLLRRLGLRRKIRGLLRMAIFLILAIAVTWLLFSDLPWNQTVDATQFDLSSLEGQREFADQVNRREPPDLRSLLPMLVGVGVLVVLVGGTFIGAAVWQRRVNAAFVVVDWVGQPEFPHPRNHGNGGDP